MLYQNQGIHVYISLQSMKRLSVCEPRKKNMLTKWKTGIHKKKLPQNYKNNLNVIFQNFLCFILQMLDCPSLVLRYLFSIISLSVRDHKVCSRDAQLSLSGSKKSKQFHNNKMLFPFNYFILSQLQAWIFQRQHGKWYLNRLKAEADMRTSCLLLQSH